MVGCIGATEVTRYRTSAQTIGMSEWSSLRFEEGVRVRDVGLRGALAGVLAASLGAPWEATLAERRRCGGEHECDQ